MSLIKPFSAIHYSTPSGDNDISTRLAPPYDVLDKNDKQTLLNLDERNFVKVDLPFIPPKSAGPSEVYEEAQRQIEAWLSDGTLVCDELPAIYVYHQAYNYEGAEFVRKMFFARLRIEPFGAGAVFPHERTFGGPKEDRLALMKATRAQLSPIFGLYEDSENIVAKNLEAALSGEPMAKGTLGGIENRAWAVTDPGAVEGVTKLMRDKAIFIADGHHRYGTAGLYRDWLTECVGEIPEEHPANYVLTVFCAMEDPGLQILPTHRVLGDVSVTSELLKRDGKLEVTAMAVSDPGEAVEALRQFGPQAVALYNAAEGKYFAIKPKDPGLLDEFEPGHGEAWRRLGLSFLHAYLLDRVVTPMLCDGKAPEIHYVKSAQASVDEANGTNGSVFLMQATTMEELRSVCQGGEVMAQKSTYFYPKLASGLLINPLS